MPKPEDLIVEMEATLAQLKASMKVVVPPAPPDWVPNILRVLNATSPKWLTTKEISDILTMENRARWGSRPGMETPNHTIGARLKEMIASGAYPTIKVNKSSYPFTYRTY